MADPFIGQIAIFGFTFAPQGWALCQGQLLPLSQNVALFTVLGTQYGGDGRSTFALPDLQGCAAIGAEKDRGSVHTLRRQGRRIDDHAGRGRDAEAQPRLCGFHRCGHEGGAGRQSARQRIATAGLGAEVGAPADRNRCEFL